MVNTIGGQIQRIKVQHLKISINNNSFFHPQDDDVDVKKQKTENGHDAENGDDDEEAEEEEDLGDEEEDLEGEGEDELDEEDGGEGENFS